MRQFIYKSQKPVYGILYLKLARKPTLKLMMSHAVSDLSFTAEVTIRSYVFRSP